MVTRDDDSDVAHLNLPAEVLERRAESRRLKRAGTPPGQIDIADILLLDEERELTELAAPKPPQS